MLKINNVKVDNSTGKVHINVNTDFYPFEIVKASAEEFSNVCRTNVRQFPETVVTLKPNDESLLNTVGFEFMNYLLAAIKNEVEF